MTPFARSLVSIISVAQAAYQGLLIGMTSTKIWAAVGILAFKAACLGLVLIMNAIHLA